MASSPHEVLSKYFEPHIRPGVENDLEYAAARAAWRTLEREHRRATRISSTTMPAVVDGALEAESARRLALQASEIAARSAEASTRALEHMGRVSRGREDQPDPEDT